MVWTCCFLYVRRCSYCLLCILILLEIDIASDMRDEATITRDQHQICWICELFRGTKATCGCDGEEWSCAMWEEVTQDVFILRIHTARVWHQQVRTPLKDYTTGKTREMRWSLEYESEFIWYVHVVILTYQRGTRSEPPLLLFLSEHRSDEIYMASGM